MSNILKEYDKQYKIGRAKLIASHYDDIVAIKLHDIMKSTLLEKFDLLDIKEIIRFDFRTNVDNMGDSHIWIDYYDIKNQLQNIYIVLNSKNYKYIEDLPNYIDINKIKISLNSKNLNLEELNEMQNKMLNIFHRGYDKQ